MMVSTKGIFSATPHTSDCPFLVTIDHQRRPVQIDPVSGNSCFISSEDYSALLETHQAVPCTVDPESGCAQACVEIRVPYSVPTFLERDERRYSPRKRSSLVRPEDLLCSWSNDYLSSNGSQHDKRARAFRKLPAGSCVSQYVKTTAAAVDACLNADFRSTVFMDAGSCPSGPDVRISKQMLRYARVIGVIEKSFLICDVRNDSPDAPSDLQYIIVDQHALHERIRLEQLEKDYLESVDCLRAASVNPYLNITIPESMECVTKYHHDLRRYGIHIVQTASAADLNLALSHVPSVLLDKNRGSGSRDALRDDLLACIAELLQFFRDGGRTVFQLPPTITSWLASMACKGAIKFGDVLPRHELDMLFPAAANCAFPFQCAHGRPSMVPVCRKM